MSIRMKKLVKRNRRKTPPSIKQRQCSRCEHISASSKDARTHFRDEHGFICMMEGI